MNKKSSAFTIVELLVVIVVIGILAAITIVSYSGISSKAIAVSLQSDLDSSKKLLALYNVDHGYFPSTLDSNYCPATPEIDARYCLKPSSGNTLEYTGDGQDYTLTATNTASGQVYEVTPTTSPVVGDVSTIDYILTISAGVNGAVNIAANGSYSPGSTPTIIATPDSGYAFSSWSGSNGCSGITTASFDITMDEDKICVAGFVLDPLAANWYPGTVATALAGKHVYKTDLSGGYWYKETNDAATSPQAATGLDPSYPSNMSLVSPQANPGVDFSVYTAQNACKAIGGRLPNVQELSAIYIGRTIYGNNFQTDNYWSSTEYIGSMAYLVSFVNGGTGVYPKRGFQYVRCIVD